MNITELEKLAKAASDERNLAKQIKFNEAVRPEVVLQLIELLREMGEALGKAIEFVPTGYGIERQCWEALDKYKEMTK